MGQGQSLSCQKQSQQQVQEKQKSLKDKYDQMTPEQQEVLKLNIKLDKIVAMKQQTEDKIENLTIIINKTENQINDYQQLSLQLRDQAKEQLKQKMEQQAKLTLQKKKAIDEKQNQLTFYMNQYHKQQETLQQHVENIEQVRDTLAINFQTKQQDLQKIMESVQSSNMTVQLYQQTADEIRDQIKQQNTADAQELDQDLLLLQEEINAEMDEEFQLPDLQVQQVVQPKVQSVQQKVAQMQ